MSRNLRFWRILRITLLVLIGLSVIAALVCYFSFDGLRQTYLALCCLIIGANFAFMYGFVRINDRKRPIHRPDVRDSYPMQSDKDD